jgi:hypothetical protein
MCSCGLLVVVVERTWIVAVARVFLSASVSERCRRPRVSLQGMEGTLYATIMSINNFGGIIGSQIGAVITAWLGVTEGHLENFWLLVPRPPPPRTNRTRRVLHPVLIGHAASLTCTRKFLAPGAALHPSIPSLYRCSRRRGMTGDGVHVGVLPYGCTPVGVLPSGDTASDLGGAGRC